MGKMTVKEVYTKAEISSLPISPEDMAKRLGIKLVSYGTMTEIYEISLYDLYSKSRFGFSYREDGRFVIAINENSCGERRRRFTIAHEIAHCVLGHLSDSADENTENSVEKERAADRFAAELLAPICVLRECGVFNSEEISRLCGISKAAAEICGKRLLTVREAPDDRAIVERFNEFISRYRNSKGKPF